MKYSLTTPQQNIWNLQKYYADSAISDICGAIFYDTRLRTDILSQAINKEIELQAGLRLQFCEIDGKPAQYVADYTYQDIPVRVFNTKEDYAVFANDFARQPVKLTGGRMYEFCIVEVEGRSGFIVKASHLISDAWSFSLFAHEITSFYNTLATGEQILENGCSYIDYIETEKQYLESEKYANDRKFWAEKYSAMPEKSIIKYSVSPISKLSSDRFSCRLSEADTKAIDDFCGESGISQAVLFESAIMAYLARINEENTSVTIGIPVLNRSTKKEKSTVGMYISTMPLTVPVSRQMTAAELCEEITSAHREIFRHQKYPYQNILQMIREKYNFSGSLFDVMVSYQNAKTEASGKTEWYSNGYSETPLELHIDNRDSTSRYTVTVDYQTELFSSPAEIKLLVNRIVGIIRQVISAPDTTVEQLDILTESEKQKVVYDFNNTAVDYPRDKCVHELFSEQAAKTPDKVALIFEDKQFTYKQLDEMSNSLAHYLREKGVKPNDVVPIIAKRSWHIIVAMLGILKAGGAYMPVDPNYPQERIQYMTRETNSSFALTNCHNYNFIFNIELSNFNYSYNCHSIDNCNAPSDLFALYFTSGSTGQPKGTKLCHQGAVNFAYANNALYSNCDSIICLSIYVFDAFFLDTICPLIRAKRCHLSNEKEQFSGIGFSHIISKNPNCNMFVTPTKFLQLVQDCNDISFIKNIKGLCVGGEVFPQELYERVKQVNHSIKLYNVYGPTETTMWVTEHYISNVNNIAIGKPLANTQIYILDKNRKPLPTGVAGELCISGDGVGKGYLNRPELTAEKFIPNPFIEGKTMYCTGDLARWREDGEIEYLGRIDTQVKIRGLRIELGEIESVMSSFDGIHMTAATDKRDENGRQYLVGYYTADSDIDEKALRRHLSAKLPKYMVPNYFVHLDEMPMTASGKTDRKNLPLPEFTASNEEYVAPETDFEKRLCNVLCEMFSVEKAGVTDDFFNDLGGDSLKAIEYVAKAHTIGVEFALQEVFDYPTVRSLCSHMEKGSEKIIRYTAGDFEKFNSILGRNVIDESFVPVKKELGNVLLTGATGFLGAHILDSLMQNETGKIYCLVRSNSPDDRRGRWPQMLQYYFGNKYDGELGKRIIPVVGDITRDGLSDNAPTDVQTVIHTAATVKHYGSYDYLRNVNVCGTKNVLNYAKRFGAKIVYISTLSVSGSNFTSELPTDRDMSSKVFDETKLYIEQPLQNVYARSKFEAECLAVEALFNGLNGVIIRVGNLSNRTHDFRFQPNYFENAFLNRLRAFLDIKMIPSYLYSFPVEFSPIDQTADGVVRIAQYADDQCVFHLNSNRPIYFDRLVEVLNQLGYRMDVVSGEKFNRTLQNLAKNSKTEYIYEAFQNDMDENGQLVYDSNIRIKNDFTDWFMKKVGFEWAQIDFDYIKGYLEYFRNLGYFEVRNEE